MSRRMAAVVPALLAMLAVDTAAPAAGGFDHAIETCMLRVVKLYGLSAGLEKGFGTGVIVSADGLVLTVFSLLIDARELRAVTSDGRTYGAEVLARDAQRQLALLKLAAPEQGATQGDSMASGSFPFFDLEREPSLRLGDWVVAAGNAFKVAAGAEPVSFAHGVYSARTRLDARRRLKDFPYRGDVLVVDAITSNPGAPGSALVNLRGELVGMIGRQVVSNLTHTHFNWAMPRDVLLEFLREARDSDKADPASFASPRGWSDAPFDPVDPGIRLSRTGYRVVLPFVERVVPGSPADLAGVRPDDLILSMNGRSIPDASTYAERVRELRAGESLNLILRRGEAIVSVQLEPEGP